MSTASTCYHNMEGEYFIVKYQFYVFNIFFILYVGALSVYTQQSLVLYDPEWRFREGSEMAGQETKPWKNTILEVL